MLVFDLNEARQLAVHIQCRTRLVHARCQCPASRFNVTCVMQAGFCVSLSARQAHAIFDASPEWRNWQTQQTQKPAYPALQTCSPIINITQRLSRAISTRFHSCASLLTVAHCLVTDKLKSGRISVGQQKHPRRALPEMRYTAGTRSICEETGLSKGTAQRALLGCSRKGR
jgi:hypothetical protein